MGKIDQRPFGGTDVMAPFNKFVLFLLMVVLVCSSGHSFLAFLAPPVAAQDNFAVPLPLRKPPPQAEPETKAEKPKPPSGFQTNVVREEPPALARFKVPLPVRKPVRQASEQDDKNQQALADALAPLFKSTLPTSDSVHLKKGIHAAYRAKTEIALESLKKIQDPYAKKLMRWYMLRSGKFGEKARAYKNFIQGNPEWPDTNKLRAHAEKALFLQNSEPGAIREFFGQQTPVSGEGLVATAKLALSAGQALRAQRLISLAWRNYELDEKTENLILKSFGLYLTPADHMARANLFLMKGQKKQLAPVRRLIGFLKGELQDQLRARASVVLRTKEADQHHKALSREQQSDPGVMFHRIQWLRRQDRDIEAWRLLEKISEEQSNLRHLDRWWDERRINSMRALKFGEAKTAYKLAHQHGLLSGRDYRDGQFLSGWLALRELDDTQKANQHFLALLTASVKPGEKARAHYWLAQSALANNEGEKAAQHLKNASDHMLSFYGQLGMLATEPIKKISLKPLSDLPTEDDIRRFRSRDTVRVLVIANHINSRPLLSLFAYHLTTTLKSPGEMVLLAELLKQMNMHGPVVRLGRLAHSRGLNFVHYAYPTDSLPQFKPLTDPVERSLLLALIRQESEFDIEAVSPVGARGLMQLMPDTASELGRKYQVQLNKEALTRNPKLNLQLGSAYLSQQIQKYHGSVVLALAAYNAGGGRVDGWLQSIGDPRTGKIDTVDWIERIPFAETRNYVQTILASQQVYRALLADGSVDLTLNKVLKQGEKVATSPATGNTGSIRHQSRLRN